VAEHAAAVENAAAAHGEPAEVVEVRDAGIVPDCDVLLMPGGESTTISRLIRREGIDEEIREHVASGKPVLATCAGLIVCSRDAKDDRVDALGLVNVSVDRNAFGRQKDSFEAKIPMTGLDEPFHAVFIRAPLIDDVGKASKYSRPSTAARSRFGTGRWSPPRSTRSSPTTRGSTTSPFSPSRRWSRERFRRRKRRESGGPPDDVLDELFATIESRKAELPEGSYTASLFTHEKGENAVLEKIGEESTETILAAKDDDLDELTYESADLVYHLLVLFAMKDLDLDDLREELRDRF